MLNSRRNVKVVLKCLSRAEMFKSCRILLKLYAGEFLAFLFDFSDYYRLCPIAEGISFT